MIKTFSAFFTLLPLSADSDDCFSIKTKSKLVESPRGLKMTASFAEILSLASPTSEEAISFPPIES